MNDPKFSISIRQNGTWFFYTPTVDLTILSVTYVYNYIDKLSKFLDENIFQNDNIQYSLMNGRYDWKGIADNIIYAGNFDDDFKQQVGKLYTTAQECFDEYYERVVDDEEFSKKDVNLIRSVLFMVRDEHFYQDIEKNKTYYKLLRLLEAQQDMKEL